MSEKLRFCLPFRQENVRVYPAKPLIPIYGIVELALIGYVSGYFDDIAQVGAGQIQHCVDILECLVGLRLDIAFAYNRAVGLDRRLTGSVNERLRNSNQMFEHIAGQALKGCGFRDPPLG